MENGLFIALLNPAIALVLSAAFLMAWLHDRTRRYLAMLAVGYAATSFGFLLQYVGLPIGFYPTKLLSNVCFGTAGVLIAAAICKHYRRPVPYVALICFGAGGVLGVLWFMTVDPNLTWRIFTMNFALGGISLLIAAEIRQVPRKTLLDKVLFGAAILLSLNFFVRTLVIVAVEGAFTGYEGLYTSVYWTSTMLSHALLSVTIALCLLTAAAMEVMAGLRLQAVTDPLSGILNRRGFAERAERSLAKASPGMTCLVLADLDHFKAVNDAHGHAVGDSVIRTFADLLRAMAGDRAIVGRIGGEEFAVLLPNCDLASARLFAEGARTALSEGGLDSVGRATGRITASFGIAAHCAKEELNVLLMRADEALYQAKRSGRDRVRLVGSRPDIGPVAIAAH